VAVFVDGCFWHGCPEHGNRRFRVNEWYWPDKIARNMARDAETNRLLAEAGWHVAHDRDTREACLAYVEEHWTDMRPRSLAEAMESAGTDGR
jgi:DNA mismatch endonuclease (patch repair protein)